MKAKKKNPVIEQARQAGFKSGYKLGLEHGRGQTTAAFLNWMDQLTEVPGIGQKTAHKIASHFIAQYGKAATDAIEALNEAKEELK